MISVSCTAAPAFAIQAKTHAAFRRRRMAGVITLGDGVGEGGEAPDYRTRRSVTRFAFLTLPSLPAGGLRRALEDAARVFPRHPGTVRVHPEQSLNPPYPVPSLAAVIRALDTLSFGLCLLG